MAPCSSEERPQVCHVGCFRTLSLTHKNLKQLLLLGGHYTADTDFRLSHRQRLVELAKEKPSMDIEFTELVQCEPSICKRMKAYYGMLPFTDACKASLSFCKMVLEDIDMARE